MNAKTKNRAVKCFEPIINLANQGKEMKYLVIILLLISCVGNKSNTELKLFNPGDCIVDNSEIEKWEDGYIVFKIIELGKHNYHVAPYYNFYKNGKSPYLHSVLKSVSFMDTKFYMKINCPDGGGN